MREILFRGKRIKDGAWIEGNLLTGRWYLDDRPITAIAPVDNAFFPHCEISEYEEVIRESVSQATGLCDKNGKKIFIGDIISVKGISGFNEVGINDDYLMLDIPRHEDESVYGLDFDESGNVPDYEVVGNIHDNPELLEVDNG